MTTQEAVKILEATRKITESISDLSEACGMAIEALEKQIPKEPIKDSVAENIFYCQTCHSWFNGYHKPHHCICGQLINWEEEE